MTEKKKILYSTKLSAPECIIFYLTTKYCRMQSNYKIFCLKLYCTSQKFYICICFTRQSAIPTIQNFLVLFVKYSQKTTLK